MRFTPWTCGRPRLRRLGQLRPPDLHGLRCGLDQVSEKERKPGAESRWRYDEVRHKLCNAAHHNKIVQYRC
eukprot:1994932-Pyramimonas_sp.AAC.1